MLVTILGVPNFETSPLCYAGHTESRLRRIGRVLQVLLLVKPANVSKLAVIPRIDPNLQNGAKWLLMKANV